MFLKIKTFFQNHFFPNLNQNTSVSHVTTNKNCGLSVGHRARNICFFAYRCRSVKSDRLRVVIHSPGYKINTTSENYAALPDAKGPRQGLGKNIISPHADSQSELPTHRIYKMQVRSRSLLHQWTPSPGYYNRFRKIVYFNDLGSLNPVP